jgi:hypothetical protein
VEPAQQPLELPPSAEPEPEPTPEQVAEAHLYGLLQRVERGELRSLTLERTNIGGLMRVTCARHKGPPLTVLRRGALEALRATFEELQHD